MAWRPSSRFRWERKHAGSLSHRCLSLPRAGDQKRVPSLAMRQLFPQSQHRLRISSRLIQSFQLARVEKGRWRNVEPSRKPAFHNKVCIDKPALSDCPHPNDADDSDCPRIDCITPFLLRFLLNLSENEEATAQEREIIQDAIRQCKLSRVDWLCLSKTS